LTRSSHTYKQKGTLKWFDVTDSAIGNWQDVPDTLTSDYFEFNSVCPITSCVLRTASSNCVNGLGLLPHIRTVQFMREGEYGGYKLQYTAARSATNGFTQDICMICTNVAGDSETVKFNNIK